MSVDLADPSSIKALVVSNDQLLFSGLQAVLSQVISMAMAPSNGSFETAIQQGQPQLIILDMESHQNATALIQKVKHTVPHAKILLLAALNENEMGGTRQALLSGVDGVALKIQPPEVLLAAVTALIQSPTNVGTVTANGHALPKPRVAMWPASLSQREQDIVHCVSQGLSNKDVADHLGISAITVRHHLTSIFSKLGVSGRQKLILQAHQEGMVQPTLSDSS